MRWPDFAVAQFGPHKLEQVPRWWRGTANHLEWTGTDFEGAPNKVAQVHPAFDERILQVWICPEESKVHRGYKYPEDAEN